MVFLIDFWSAGVGVLMGGMLTMTAEENVCWRSGAMLGSARVGGVFGDGTCFSVCNRGGFEKEQGCAKASEFVPKLCWMD